MKRIWIKPAASMLDDWLSVAEDNFYIVEGWTIAEWTSYGPFENGAPFGYDAYEKIGDEKIKRGAFVDGRFLGHHSTAKEDHVWGDFLQSTAYVDVHETGIEGLIKTLEIEDFHKIAESFKLTLPSTRQTRSMLVDFFHSKVGEREFNSAVEAAHDIKEKNT